MRDMISEKLIQLATAQGCMTDVADMMEHWANSQLNTEKIAYESLNESDKVLNMSKEGYRLIELLQDCCKEISAGTTADKYLKMTALLEEIKNLFQNINEATSTVNDISHKIEGEVAFQKEIEEEIRSHLVHVGESLDIAVACAELTLAEI